MRLSCVKKIVSVIIFSLIAVLVWWPQLGWADDAEDGKSSTPEKSKTDDADYTAQSYIEKIKGCFFGDLRILSYGVIQEPAKSSQNPDNNFIQFTHYTAAMQIRPDLRLDFDFLELSVKPRAQLEFLIWEEGLRSGETQWKCDWYVNEWLIRMKPWEKLLVSYGRENLQWGPSFLFSPSNPFFSDNGRSNPYLEVPGMDFARLVFIPHNFLTLSFIVNTDEGRNTGLGLDPFEKTYALKIDYAGQQNYASLILSQKDNNKTMGFYGGWTVSDAILLYGEGSLTKGKKALYPLKDMSPLQSYMETIYQDNPEIKPVVDEFISLWGAAMQKIYPDDSEIYPVILLGGSYTLEDAGTIYIEYAYNGLGYSSEEANRYYCLRNVAATAFEMGGIPGLLGQYVLLQTANSGLKFLRKNYAMLQYYKGGIKNKLDLTLRWTQNLDDGSAQFLGILSYSMGNNWELFSTGMINSGKGNTEYGSFLDYQVMFGLKFTL